MILNGNELKEYCKTNGLNYWTLIWTRHKNRPVMSGPLKDYRLDQLTKYTKR